MKDNNCIFSLINGKSNKSKNKYKFFMKNKGTKIQSAIFVCDPSYDSTFKNLFSENKERLKNFLNAIYFNSIGKRIVYLKIDYNEFTNINSLYNVQNLRADLICNCRLEGQEKDDPEIFVDVEIQIGWRKDLDYQLFKYGCGMTTTPQKKNKTNSFVLCLILDNSQKKDSSKVNLVESEFHSNQEFELDYLKIVKFNINNEIERIMMSPSDSSCNDKDEWLKFIGLRFWCNRYDETRFILPKDNISHNPFINQCCYELSSLNNIELNKIYEIEHYEENIEKKYEIKYAFISFLSNKDNSSNNIPKLEHKYDEEEIRNILKEKINSNDSEEKEAVEEFIKLCV